MKKILLALALLLSVTSAKNMPKFSLQDMNGKTVSSQSLLGKGPLVINFWATWCIPCMQEMTAMKPMFDKYKGKGLQVVSISIDDAKTVSKVPAMVKLKGFPYMILLDSNKEVYQKFGISNAPELLVIDKNGKIVLHHQGYTPGDEKETEKAVKELLGE